MLRFGVLPEKYSHADLLTLPADTQRVRASLTPDGQMGAWDLYTRYPVLTWFGEPLKAAGWGTDDMVDALCVSGMAAALLVLLGLRHGLLFGLLWAGYLTLYLLGQTFYTFQCTYA